MRMTQGSAPISDQAPENFDSLPAIFSGDWSEARTCNGGTSGAFMQAGVRTSGTSRPFCSTAFSPVGRLPGEKLAFALFTPTSARGLRILFCFLTETNGVEAGAGRLGGGKVRALGA